MDPNEVMLAQPEVKLIHPDTSPKDSETDTDRLAIAREPDSPLAKISSGRTEQQPGEPGEKQNDIQALRRSAPLGAWSTFNRITNVLIVVGGTAGFLAGMALLPPKWHYLIPWTESGTRMMPPTLFIAGLCGFLIGAFIATFLAFAVRSLLIRVQSKRT